MKKYTLIFIGIYLALGAIVYGAPVIQNFTNIAPFVDNTYDNGTSTPAQSWKHVYTYGLNIATTTNGCMQGTNGVTYFTGTDCTAALIGTTGQVAYFSGTNTAVGTSTITISTASNVGIGTTTPWGKLSITTASSSAPAFVISTSSRPSFIVLSNTGNVGINTLTPFPSAQLEINGGSDLKRLMFNTANTAGNTVIGAEVQGNTRGLCLTVQDSAVPDPVVDGSTTGCQMFITSVAITFNGVLTLRTAPVLGTNGGAFGSFAAIDYNTANTLALTWKRSSDGWLTAGLAPYYNGAGFQSNLAFGTNTGQSASSFSTKMVIMHNGFIGVGTSTPQYLFTSATTTAPQIALSAGGGISQWTMRNAGGNLYIAPTNTTGTATSTTAVTILNGGNVGIGSTTPSAQLSIGGVTGTTPLAISTTSPTLASSTLFKITEAGEIVTGGGTPTVTCLGTCSLDGHSNDQAGTINVSGVQTAVTVTFSVPKPWAPHCVSDDSSAVSPSSVTAVSTTAITISVAASIGSGFISYICTQ